MSKSVFDLGLDYTSLVKTDEYRKFSMTLPLSMPFNKFASGNIIDLIGDLIEIKITGTNDISLLILYNMYGTETYYARVDVIDDKLKDIIRTKFRTNRGVKLLVKFTDKGVDTFELVEIKEFDNPCIYGQWICKSCGYNYKYDSGSASGCCICGGEVEQIFDFYKGEEK